MKLLLGDCLDKLKDLPDNSIDSIVTDPPYGLSFMGKKWDYDVPDVAVWEECLRVLKPGGHLLAFAGTRTQHRMAVRIEDAGFEIRDMIAWVYGSGFPKSLDVSKAIDKAAGAEREVIGEIVRGDVQKAKTSGVTMAAADANKNNQAIWGYGIEKVTAPATEDARQWQGWGTALKPALEPITVARKPLIGTVAANVLEHGTGAINVDGCRVPTEDKLGGGRLSGPTSMSSTCGGPEWDRPWMNNESKRDEYAAKTAEKVAAAEELGRFPANLIHDGSNEVIGFAGEQARFFYCAKTNKKDRDEGCDDLPMHQEGLQLPRGKCPECNTWKNAGEERCKCGGEWEMTSNPPPKARNNHPTVKPTDLMRYLCRLVTPQNGIVLDPFMGSGSTGKAAAMEGFDFIGIERDPDYHKIAEARIERATLQ